MRRVVGSAWALLHRPRTCFTVEPVLFLFMFATFLSYSSFQQLVHSLVCQQTPNCMLNQTLHHCQQNLSNASWDEQEVQSKSSHWILYINLASGIPAILVSLFYGSLSDQVGRRFFIVLPALWKCHECCSCTGSGISKYHPNSLFPSTEHLFLDCMAVSL